MQLYFLLLLSPITEDISDDFVGVLEFRLHLIDTHAVCIKLNKTYEWGKKQHQLPSHRGEHSNHYPSNTLTRTRDPTGNYILLCGMEQWLHVDKRVEWCPCTDQEPTFIVIQILSIKAQTHSITCVIIQGSGFCQALQVCLTTIRDERVSVLVSPWVKLK